jgi:hypothetical protein
MFPLLKLKYVHAPFSKLALLPDWYKSRVFS